jgi:hypothetical protein
MDFVSRYAVLARVHHVGRHPPFGEGHLRALEYGSDRHGELAFAFVAIVQSGTMRVLLALDLGKFLLIGVPAMRADRAIGPTDGLKGFAGLVLIVKHGVLKDCGHGFCSNDHVLRA